ncbi:MAG: sigma-70 family RNA polymerase sigma factor [Clostridiales bacterium]|nr:sigma-70 family RNA polymerase sigma factor [Clostridiales bacterium]
MSNNANYQKEYEERFNWYILKTIRKTYKNYLKSRRQQYMDSFGQFHALLCENEIVGDYDVLFEEEIVPQRLEDVMSDFKMYKSIKPLTFNEKVVVFLYFILEKNTQEIADIMGYKDRSSINRICNRAIKKIKSNFEEMEADNND